MSIYIYKDSSCISIKVVVAMSARIYKGSSSHEYIYL